MAGLLPTAPLRHAAFRRLWLGGVISNLGTMVQSVGAGWLMTSISSSTDLVALVQAVICAGHHGRCPQQHHGERTQR